VGSYNVTSSKKGGPKISDTWTDQNIGNNGIITLSNTYEIGEKQVGSFAYLKVIASSSLVMLLFFIAYQKSRVQKKKELKESV